MTSLNLNLPVSQAESTLQKPYTSGLGFKQDTCATLRRVTPIRVQSECSDTTVSTFRLSCVLGTDSYVCAAVLHDLLTYLVDYSTSVVGCVREFG